MYAIAKGYTEEDYTLPGEPMRVDTLKGRIRSAKSRIKAGQHYTGRLRKRSGAVVKKKIKVICK